MAQVTAERGLQLLEDLLGEEDEEGEEPSYNLQLTELTTFSNSTTYVELATLCRQLRNKLIATKAKQGLNIAEMLDRLAWQLDHIIDPADEAIEILPQYDTSRMWTLCDDIWHGRTPTT